MPTIGLYIFCHILISLDSKIMGKYMDRPEGMVAAKVFMVHLELAYF